MSSGAFKAEDRPVRIGVQIAPQHAAYQQHRDAVRRAEDLGADIAFNWDHFYPLTGDTEGMHFEAWTELAAWAEQTERIELGPLVNCNSYRNPNLQADMARTVDHISGGRFVFGTGAGWNEKDYGEYGYEFGTPGSRLDALARDLPIIRARWERLNPPPVRRIPILIGGAGERKTLRIAAEHADIWHAFTGPERIAHKLDVLQRHADEVGRDVSEIEIADDLGGRDDDEADLLFEAGVRLFTIGIGGPDFDFDEVQRRLRWRDAKNG